MADVPSTEHLEAHRVSTVVLDDGVVQLQDVPVSVGDRVELLILIKRKAADQRPLKALYPLRGKRPYRCGNVVDPVLEDDWESWS